MPQSTPSKRRRQSSKATANGRQKPKLRQAEKPPAKTGPKKNGDSVSPFSLADIGIDKKQSERWQAEASVPEEVFKAHVEATKAEGKELTTASVLKIAAEIKSTKRKAKRRQEHPPAVSRTSPINGHSRRTRSQIAGIRAAIHDLLVNDHPMTVRQVFYRLVSNGTIGKTENEYKSTVCRLLAAMRRSGTIPFGWIADNTRWMRKPRTHAGLESMLKNSAELYRRAIWDDQPVYVEVWLEKDALAGVLYDVTAEWDVPLMVTRGYSSISYLYEAADAIADQGKPAYLYYFGDFDPSGVDITRAVEKGLREFAPDAEIHFQRVAVTPKQIKVWKLPTRPTKKSDSRSKNFGDESVEVDAIEPAQLRKLVRSCIEQHVDDDLLESTQRTERLERETLDSIASNWKVFEGGDAEDDE